MRDTSRGREGFASRNVSFRHVPRSGTCALEYAWATPFHQASRTPAASGFNEEKADRLGTHSVRGGSGQDDLGFWGKVCASTRGSPITFVSILALQRLRIRGGPHDGPRVDRAVRRRGAQEPGAPDDVIPLMDPSVRDPNLSPSRLGRVRSLFLIFLRERSRLNKNGGSKEINFLGA